MNFSPVAKVTIAKLFELAYSKDKGLTASIIAGKGSASLTVDENGKATLSSSAGILIFSGQPALNTIGAKVKKVSILFTNENGMDIGYTGVFDLGVGRASVKGKFNLEELITACSGLLCRAARALKARDQQILKIMGN